MRVRVVVSPSVRRERLEEVKPNVFAISVREKAERNEANDRACALVARHFGVRPQAVRILSGHRRRSKVVQVSR